ncbi:hypothetical protein FN846DRAFT_766249, partial [Sphaerosporella brunnea]
NWRAVDKFDREYSAYSRLVHHGAAPYVPRVFGYLEFTEPAPFTDHIQIALPAEGLLLEDFPSAQQLSWENLTPTVAVEAFRAVEAVHAALVIHGDVEEWNFLVVDDNKVVLIDFDVASTW